MQKTRCNQTAGFIIFRANLFHFKFKATEVQVQGIEQNLENIIKEFTEMKSDLSFLLRGDE